MLTLQPRCWAYHRLSSQFVLWSQSCIPDIFFLEDWIRNLVSRPNGHVSNANLQLLVALHQELWLRILRAWGLACLYGLPLGYLLGLEQAALRN